MGCFWVWVLAISLLVFLFCINDGTASRSCFWFAYLGVAFDLRFAAFVWLVLLLIPSGWTLVLCFHFGLDCALGLDF